MIVKIFEISLRFKKLILTFSAALLIFLILQIPTLKVFLSISDTVGEQVPSAKITSTIKEEFEQGHKLLMLISSPGGLNFNQACSIKKWLKKQTDTNHLISNLSSPFRLRGVESTTTSLWFNKVLSDPCLVENPKSPYALELKKLFLAPTGDFYTTEKLEDLVIQMDFAHEEVGKFGNFNPLTYQVILESFTELKKEGLEISAMGDMSFLYWVTVGIKWYNKLNIIFLFILIVLFRYFYGTWRGGVLLVGNFATMGIILYGLMALTGTRIDTLSNGLFLIMSVAALEDFIFVSEQKISDSDWRDSFKKMITPGIFTSLTTFIGFGSLCLADMPMIFKFGFWAAIGAVIEFIVTFVMMPAFIEVFPYFSKWVNADISIKRRNFGVKLLKRKINRPLAKLLVLLGFLSFFGLKFFNIEMDAVGYFPKSHEFPQGVQKLYETRGWQDQAWLIFKNPLTDKSEIIEEISKLTIVSHLDYAAKILESITKGEGDLRSQLIKTNYKRTKHYENFVREHERVIVYLKDRSSKKINQFINEVEAICGGRCELAGDSIMLAELSKNVSEVLVESFIISIFLVFLIIFILGKIKKTQNLLALILGSLWGPFVVIGLIAIFQIPINHMSCVFIGVIVGLTGDNAIQYIFSSEKNLEESMLSKGMASIQIMLFMIAASSIFQFTYFVPPRKLGLLLCVGFITSLIGDYWITRSIKKSS